jgi:hypothetical protein
LLVLAALTAGCLNEYHPEYHPQTSTTYVQNVSYPTTYVTQVIAPPAVPTGHASVAPPERPAVARSRSAAPPRRWAAPSRDATVAAAPPAAEWAEPRASSAAQVADGTDPGNDERVVGAAPLQDLGELAARCGSGDPASCRALPGIHISGNVQIHGNVTMFGDVYLDDSAPRRAVETTASTQGTPPDERRSLRGLLPWRSWRSLPVVSFFRRRP